MLMCLWKERVKSQCRDCRGPGYQACSGKSEDLFVQGYFAGVEQAHFLAQQPLHLYRIGTCYLPARSIRTEGGSVWRGA